MKTDTGLEKPISKFEKGVWLSFASLLILPLGGYFGAVGICAGPRSASGAFAILAVGIVGTAAALFAAIRVVRNILSRNWLLRMLGVLSLCISVFVAFIGWIYALEAVDGLKSYLHIGN